MIGFNKPCLTGNEKQYILESLQSDRMSGDGEFSQRCHAWFEKKFNCQRALLTTSCTHALEMAALLIDVKEGDEIIMPSYTFVSTANAFVLRGAKIIFVDVSADTMNINAELIEQAITEKTKAIVPVHYAGVGCKMEVIMALAQKYNLYVIEDAAQGMMSEYNGKPLGTIGHLSTISFHETKNYTSGGEGGLLIINDERFIDKAEIIRDKGTNRRQFCKGIVDKYSWIDMGSSYLMNDLSAAYLWGQLEKADLINQDRMNSWKRYYMALKSLEKQGFLELPKVPSSCKHNGHIFYIKVKDKSQRTELLDYLKEKKINAVFHYVPLHSSPAGLQFGEFIGEEKFTTKESERLIRLPMYYGLTDKDIDEVIRNIKTFFKYSNSLEG